MAFIFLEKNKAANSLAKDVVANILARDTAASIPESTVPDSTFWAAGQAAPDELKTSLSELQISLSHQLKSSNDNFKSLNFESIDFQKSLNRDSESVSTWLWKC